MQRLNSSSPKWNYPYENGQTSTTTNSLSQYFSSTRTFAAKISTSKYYLFGFVSALTYCEARDSDSGNIHSPQFINPRLLHCVCFHFQMHVRRSMEWHSQCQCQCGASNLPIAQSVSSYASKIVFNVRWEIGEREREKMARTNTHIDERIFRSGNVPIVTMRWATALAFVRSADEWGFSNDSKSKIFCY